MCVSALQPDTNHALSPPSRAFLFLNAFFFFFFFFLNAMLSDLAPALNGAAATRSLTPTKARLAAVVRKHACQKKKKKNSPPPKLAAFHKQFHQLITHLGVYWEMADSYFGGAVCNKHATG